MFIVKIVSEIGSVADKFGDIRAIELYAEAGFRHLDFSMFRMDTDTHPLCGDGWQNYVKLVKATADRLGVSFTQAHAPFPTVNYLRAGYSEKMQPRVCRSIEVAGMLGIKHIVVHPCLLCHAPAGVTDQKAYNVEIYRQLLPYAQKWDVVICLENMWDWDGMTDRAKCCVCSTSDQFAEYVDALNDRHFAACLDIGHAGMVGERAQDAIRGLGHRLEALHVHDNDDHYDLHQIPFTGRVEWGEVIKALREVGYKGELTFETCGWINNMPPEPKLILDSLKYLYSLGEYLVSEITK